MRPHWDPGHQGVGELEALQTDVMRFIAILGLCLAAIFSLLNGSGDLAPGAEQKPVENHDTDGALVNVERPLPSTGADRAETAEPSAERAGYVEQARSAAADTTMNPAADAPEPRAFTLEFESGEVFQRLLTKGAIRLFLGESGQFRVYRPGRGFEAVEAPRRLYRMQADTVPENLRSRLSGLGVSGPVEWGITLPEATESGIRRLLNDATGGSLLIGADASVRLEGQ